MLLLLLLLSLLCIINCDVPSGSVPLPDNVTMTICQEIICLLEAKHSIVLNDEIFVAVFSRNLGLDAYLALYIGWLNHLFSKSPHRLHFVVYEFGETRDAEETQVKTSFGLVMLSILPKKSIFLCFEQGANVFGLRLLTHTRTKLGIGASVIIHLNHEQPWLTGPDDHPDFIFPTLQEVKDSYREHPYVFRNYYLQYFNDVTVYFPVGPSKFGFHIDNPTSVVYNYVPIKASQRENYCMFIGRLGYDFSQGHSQAYERQYLTNNDITPCQTIIRQPDEKMVYQEYLTLVAKTTFVLCPAGNNPETFRLYESLELGSIPLFVRPTIDVDYLQYKYWYNYPGPIFNSWDELKPFLTGINGSYVDELQLKIIKWYKEFKENVQHNITDTMLMAFNEDKSTVCNVPDNDIDSTTTDSNYIEVLEKKLDSVDKQYQIIMKELKYYVSKANNRIKSLYDAR